MKSNRLSTRAKEWREKENNYRFTDSKENAPTEWGSCLPSTARFPGELWGVSYSFGSWLNHSWTFDVMMGCGHGLRNTLLQLIAKAKTMGGPRS